VGNACLLADRASCHPHEIEGATLTMQVPRGGHFMSSKSTDGEKNSTSVQDVTRRNMLLSGGSLLALSALTSASTLVQPRLAEAQAGSKPNVLVIFGDGIGQTNISACVCHRGPELHDEEIQDPAPWAGSATNQRTSARYRRRYLHGLAASRPCGHCRGVECACRGFPSSGLARLQAGLNELKVRLCHN